jgi:hypothetical protein
MLTEPFRDRLPAAWDVEDRTLFEPVPRLRAWAHWWTRLRRLWVR